MMMHIMLVLTKVVSSQPPATVEVTASVSPSGECILQDGWGVPGGPTRIFCSRARGLVGGIPQRIFVNAIFSSGVATQLNRWRRRAWDEGVTLI